MTGASSGIGRARAIALGKAGADVVNYISRDAPFHEMTLAQWESVIAVNLAGQFLCAREAVREFTRRGVVAAVSCAAGKIICIRARFARRSIPRPGRRRKRTRR